MTDHRDRRQQYSQEDPYTELLALAERGLPGFDSIPGEREPTLTTA